MLLNLVVDVMMVIGSVVLVSSCLVISSCCVCVNLIGDMLNCVLKICCRWCLVMLMCCVSVVMECVFRKLLLISVVVVLVRLLDRLSSLWLGVSLGW